MNFNPRSPRGGATSSKTCPIPSPSISIHAPHEGERQSDPDILAKYQKFQSTLPTRGSDSPTRRTGAVPMHFNPRSPRGGATSTLVNPGVEIDISIHAPHEGERQEARMAESGIKRFQSTLPTRGSDCVINAVVVSLAAFQSTLPTRGSDNHISGNPNKRHYFNPRSPRGGATKIHYTKY